MCVVQGELVHSFARTLQWLLSLRLFHELVGIVVSFVIIIVPFTNQAHPSLLCIRGSQVDMRHWKPSWVQDGDGYRKAYFEEWEQVAPVSPSSQSTCDDQSQWLTTALSQRMKISLTVQLSHVTKEKAIASASHSTRRRLEMTDGPHHTVHLHLDQDSHLIYSAVVLAARHKFKCRAEAPGPSSSVFQNHSTNQ